MLEIQIPRCLYSDAAFSRVLQDVLKTKMILMHASRWWFEGSRRTVERLSRSVVGIVGVIGDSGPEKELFFSSTACASSAFSVEGQDVTTAFCILPELLFLKSITLIYSLHAQQTPSILLSMFILFPPCPAFLLMLLYDWMGKETRTSIKALSKLSDSDQTNIIPSVLLSYP